MILLVDKNNLNYLNTKTSDWVNPSYLFLPDIFDITQQSLTHEQNHNCFSILLYKKLFSQKSWNCEIKFLNYVLKAVLYCNFKLLKLFILFYTSYIVQDIFIIQVKLDKLYNISYFLEVML